MLKKLSLYQIKLLILFSSSLLLIGCGFKYTSIYQIPDRKYIFVDSINNLNGILLQNELKKFFPLQDPKKAQYILKVELTNKKIYSNTDKTGLATNITIKTLVSYQLLNKKNNTIIFKSNIEQEANYGYNTSAFKVSETERHEKNIMTKKIAYEIAQNIAMEKKYKQNETKRP